MVASPSLMTTSHPWKGRGRGQVDPWNISATSGLQILYTSWPREVLAF